MVIIETLVLRRLKFHEKNNTQGSDKHCEGMHFKLLLFNLTFHLYQHTLSKVSFIFEKLFKCNGNSEGSGFDLVVVTY